MATYPSGIYSYTNRSGTQTLLAGTHSTAHNEASAEIIAVETELGTNPKGGYSDVTARLDGLAAAIGAQHTQNTDVGSSSATFYLGGSSGPKIKENSGVIEVRNNGDNAYIDFTCASLTCDDINGITAVQLTTIQTNSHTHANKALLDTYTQTEVDLASAVSLKHTQDTDTGTDSETFQMNNGNATSAKIKVDDLTPTIVDIRNAADDAFADLRADNLRGDLQCNNADLNRPTIRFNDGVTETWQFSNDGTTFYDITTAPGFTVSDTVSIDLSIVGTTLSADVLPAGVDHDQLLNFTQTEHYPVGGAATYVQYNDGAGGLAGEAAFYYNTGTNTLYVDNINVSGLIVGSVVAGGTTSATWEVNSGGNGLTLDTAGLVGDIIILATELDELTDGSTTTLHTHDHDGLINYAADQHVAHSTVTLTAGAGLTGGGTIAANRTFTVGAGTGITVNADDIDVSADYSVISGNDAATDVTAAELETLTDGSNADALHAHAGSADEQVKIDVAATAGYIGAASNDGVLRVTVTNGLTYTDGGDFVTLAFDADYADISGNDAATDVTGAQLETLSDGSNADTLHVHTATGVTITLDDAYNAGNSVDVDGSPVTLTVSDTDNNIALQVTQNDVTNDPAAMQVTNSTTGEGVVVNATGNGPHLNFIGDPTVAAPADGDLWWTGTALNFYDGASTTNLIAAPGSTLTRGTFTNATLAAGILTITHSAGLAAPYTVMVTIFDNNAKQIIPDDITGATNSVAVDLSSYGTLTGTWGYCYIA